MCFEELRETPVLLFGIRSRNAEPHGSGNSDVESHTLLLPDHCDRSKAIRRADFNPLV